MKYLELMRKEWVRLALTDAGFLKGIFLAACRHLSENHQQHQFLQLAIQYKLASVRALSEAISAGMASVSDATIAIVMMLAFDEVSLYA